MIQLDAVLITVVLGIVLGFALLAIRAPIRVRLNNWHSADSRYEPCGGNSLPPDLTQTVADLRDLGFVVRGHWRLTGHSTATGQITLMEHPQALDLAKLLVTAAGTRRQFAILFQTRFEDGTEVTTANNQLSVGLPSLPETTVLWLPEVHNARQLYAVHSQVRDSLGGAKKRLSVGQDPAAFLSEGRHRHCAHFVKTGYYYLDETRGVYRPTWKGAVLMTWRLLWPIRPFYRAWRRWPTRELLREQGLDLEVD